MAATLTLRELNRATLARQLLLAREELPVIEAVPRLGGLQAQEPKPPFLALWSRLAGFRREDLHDALHERRLVRGLLMRATLHITAAEDYRAFVPALAPVMAGAGRSILRQRGGEVDAADVVAAARTLLQDGPLRFDELRPLLHERFPDVDERALGYLVRTHLPMVMVPSEDRWAFPPAASFTPADAWLGQPIPDDPSPTALVLRHLAAFGPATAADVASWTGLRRIAAVLDGVREQLVVLRDERGRELFDLPDAPRPGPDVDAPPRFLPDFDSLILAHADRTRLLADEHRGEVVTKNLRVRATFLLDGVVAGTWRVERRRDRAVLRLAPFAPLPKRALPALAEEGEALLRFAEEDAAHLEVRGLTG
jgi:hypothetical protein